KNPFKYMANADLLVLASLYEGLPTVVSEALLCGLPVFSSEVAGIDELLNEDYGIVVKNDEESIYQGLRDLLMHPERIDQMKKALTDYHGNREEDLRKIEELFQ
ncbi:MAG: glycosyltransferase, partial [Erysipelotrichaceae bacterium]|nr:glycosyltransferase [Erysipelotrichaceae bacterium]